MYPSNGSATRTNNNNGIKAKICLVGDRQVGKSSLIYKYVLDQFSDKYLATLGMKVYKKIIYVVPPSLNKAIPVTMTIWDIMGDGEYGESMRDIYMHGAAGIMAVADVNSPQSVSSLNRWLGLTAGFLGDVPMQIMLNKWDKGENDNARNFGLKISKNHLAPCYMTSASRGDNVERAFSELANRILAQTLRASPLSDSRVIEVLVDSIGESRSLEELSTEFGISPAHAEPKVRNLVRSGHLKLDRIELASDGSPVMNYIVTTRLNEK